MSCDHVEPGVTPLRANVEFVDGTPMGVLISIEVYIANSICVFACVFLTTPGIVCRRQSCMCACACACACVRVRVCFVHVCSVSLDFASSTADA